jgi:hypothetical protein
MLTRLLALAAGGLMLGFGLTCHSAPASSDSFDEGIIQQELAALDSVGSTYLSQLQAGNPDLAVSHAVAELMSHPGVDTAGVGPDSSLWAMYTNGLTASVAYPIAMETAGSSSASRRAARPAPELMVCSSGGEVPWFASSLYLFAPFYDEVHTDSTAVWSVFDALYQNLDYPKGTYYTDLGVNLGNVVYALAHGPQFYYWRGPGFLTPQARGAYYVSTLLTGYFYDRPGIAHAAAGQYKSYFKPGSGSPLVAIREYEGAWYIEILPAFITAYAKFHLLDGIPDCNYAHTFVYLSSPYSMYAGAATPPSQLLYWAFGNAGATIVAGYNWAMSSEFACDVDTTFFDYFADTCDFGEAQAAVSGKQDPHGFDGKSAFLSAAGDATLMFQSVFQMKENGILLRPAKGGVWHLRNSDVDGNITTEMDGTLVNDDTSQKRGLAVTFPGDGPGSFDVMKTDKAQIQDQDLTDQRIYYAQQGYQGVSGQINITQCDSSSVYGTFSGTLGYWTPGQDPTSNPPALTVSVSEGLIKYTGITVNNSDR